MFHVLLIDSYQKLESIVVVRILCNCKMFKNIWLLNGAYYSISHIPFIHPLTHEFYLCLYCLPDTVLGFRNKAVEQDHLVRANRQLAKFQAVINILIWNSITELRGWGELLLVGCSWVASPRRLKWVLKGEMEVATRRTKGRMIFMQRDQVHKLFTWEKFRVFKERKEARVIEE